MQNLHLTFDWHKSKMKILQNFVAFSEYMNFTQFTDWFLFGRIFQSSLGKAKSIKQFGQIIFVKSHLAKSLYPGVGFHAKV